MARHDGRVVFVADTIPGERVRAVITEARKKSFARASTIEVLEASSDRRPHIWPEAALEREPDLRAGGAEFGHISLERQRALKADVLDDALRRFGRLGDKTIKRVTGSGVTVQAAPGDDESGGLGWRTRVRLHVDPETGAAGPYAARSRRVIPVTSLPLAVDEIEQLAPLGETLPGAATVDLVAPRGDDPRMLVTHGGERAPVGARDRVREVVAVEHPEHPGEHYELEFAVSASGFWQVHRAAPTVLFEGVRGAILSLIDAGRFEPTAPNLDLYGGVGLLAAAMADAAGSTLKVTTVESSASATDDAAENLSGLVGGLAVTARVDRYLAELLTANPAVRDRMRRATVVLDPPRSGAGGEVCAQLAELAPANLVYVACDPVALARDIASLQEQGYELVSLRAFDLFPHTHHVEALAVFTR